MLCTGNTCTWNTKQVPMYLKYCPTLIYIYCFFQFSNSHKTWWFPMSIDQVSLTTAFAFHPRKDNANTQNRNLSTYRSSRLDNSAFELSIYIYRALSLSLSLSLAGAPLYLVSWICHFSIAWMDDERLTAHERIPVLLIRVARSGEPHQTWRERGRPPVIQFVPRPVFHV